MIQETRSNGYSDRLLSFVHVFSNF